MVKPTLALLAFTAGPKQCVGLQVQNHANPIRKVVTMIQNLKAKVEGEGAKEREIHDKYMCYCKNGASSLEKSIADAGPKLPQLESAIKASEVKQVQLEQDIKGHQEDQAACKSAMVTATAVRAKANAAFASEIAEEQVTLKTFQDGITALKMMPAGSSFMQSTFGQSTTAQNLKKIVLTTDNMNDGDRGELVSFLSDSSGEYAPNWGEIIGIISTMANNTIKDIDELNATEIADVKSYDGLIVAKQEELEPIQSMKEEKLLRVGETAVETVQMKNDLGDKGEKILEDRKFLADLDKNCAHKEKFFAANVQGRAEEIQALADTIKVLNDDDALELFKKTLPSASSFMQISETAMDMRNRALLSLKGVKSHSAGIDFIMLSLQGKKAGNEKVIKLITELAANLEAEGQADADKKEYCAFQFDQADDKKKLLEREVGDHESAISDLSSMPAQLNEEIDALGDGIRELDNSVTDATEQRKEEANAYAPLMAGDATAKELILYAKNRLNKFYNPKLYKGDTRLYSEAKVRDDEDRATVAAGGTLEDAELGGIADTGIGTRSFAQEPLPPPPAAVEAYGKKSQESGGVIALMDLIVKDLDKEMLEAQLSEKNSQEDYVIFMKDASEKRAEDSKTLSNKEGVLADTNARLLEAKDAKGNSENNLMAVHQYIGNMHADCDWLIKYFDMRAEARNNEIDAMHQAKNILSGASYSFLQFASKQLRR